MSDETEVKTRHKRKLEALRGKDNYYGGQDGEISRGYFEAPSGGVQSAQGTIERNIGATGIGEEGMDSSEGAARGHDQGVRSIDTTNVTSVESNDRGDYTVGENKLTAEEKAEHERELARQRKQRQRDKEKLEASQGDDQFLSSNRDRDRDNLVTHEITPSHGDMSRIDETSRFQLKNPFKFEKKEPEKVKLFSKSEATDEETKKAITFVYAKGSEILDEILEIIVKGHEPVSIWTMDEEEAMQFAEMHLKKAQKDEDAARSARVLLRIHDRLFTLTYIGFRVKATFSHVKDHGGLGFR